MGDAGPDGEIEGAAAAGGAAGAGACANHPKRLPVGRCPLCRRLVCAECHVRLDGILHCRECLAERERELVEKGPGGAARVAAAVVALGLLFPALLGLEGFLKAVGTVTGRLSRRAAPALEKALDTGVPK